MKEKEIKEILEKDITTLNLIILHLEDNYRLKDIKPIYTDLQKLLAKNKRIYETINQ